MNGSRPWSEVVEVLRLPHFTPFLATRIGAAMGVWMERLATGWLAWDLTQSTAWLGVIAFLRMAPALALGLVGGAWADRTTPRRVLLWGKSGLVVANAAMVLLLIGGSTTIWALALMALSVGVLQALSNPAAATIIWDLVPRHHLSRAITINSLGFHVATFAGPALAGGIALVAGFGSVYAIAAAGQTAMIVALLKLPSPAQATSAKRKLTLWADIVEGIAYVRREPPVFAILAVHFIFAISAYPLIDMVPAIASVLLDGGANEVSALMAAMGAGAIAGGIWLAAVAPKSALKLAVGIALLCLMVQIVALSATRALPLALALMAGIGACQVIRASGLQTLLQLTVSEEMRGRAMGFYGLLIRGGSAFGALAIGVASEAIGLPTALATAASLGVCVLLIFAVRHRQDLSRISVS